MYCRMLQRGDGGRNTVDNDADAVENANFAPDILPPDAMDAEIRSLRRKITLKT